MPKQICDFKVESFNIELWIIRCPKRAISTPSDEKPYVEFINVRSRISIFLTLGIFTVNTIMYNTKLLQAGQLTDTTG